jgi:CrcB protein
MNATLALYVAFGGAIGSVSRYALTLAIQSRMTSTFPAATLVINLTGSLLLGFISQLAMESMAINDELRVLLTVGFCGGYTTFSTFSYETARLMQDGDYRRAALYVASSVILALAGTFAGFALARALLAARSGVA